MTVKRLNFTQRIKLTRDEANVLIHPGQPATFEAVLDLSRLPDSQKSARVFIEAYHRTTRMRFPFGTVESHPSPPQQELRLTDFPDWKDVRFRIKVTDVGESPGRIVAWANNIQPKGPDDDEQDDLVRWKDKELNGRLWDMDFDESGPYVVVEKAIGYANLGQNNDFRAAAYPEILRRTLVQALLIDKATGDDPEDWFTRWTEGFLVGKLHLQPPPQDDDPGVLCKWIDDAVEQFCRHFNFASIWLAGSEAKGTDR